MGTPECVAAYLFLYLFCLCFRHKYSTVLCLGLFGGNLRAFVCLFFCSASCLPLYIELYLENFLHEGPEKQHLLCVGLSGVITDANSPYLSITLPSFALPVN
jgi:hypothetical protein